MKKWLLIGSLVMVIGLLAVAVAIPALAQGPETPFAPKTGVAPGWVDEDGDGVCDYAGAGHRGGRAMRGGWHHSSEGGMITVAADLLGWISDFGLVEEEQAVGYMRVEHNVTGDQARDLISLLKRRGDLYEPRPGWLAASGGGGGRRGEGGC